MTDLPEMPIFEQYSDWTIEPLRLGWSATRTSCDGRHIHTVTAPTITELRVRLAEVTSRASQPRPFLDVG